MCPLPRREQQAAWRAAVEDVARMLPELRRHDARAVARVALEHAARQLLSGDKTGTPKTGDGRVESLRLIKIARDTAVKCHSQAMITLKSHPGDR